MTNKVAIKFAASSLVIGLTVVGCKPAADMYRPAAASAKAAKADRIAAAAFQKAQASHQKGKSAEALSFAERAVEASPRDAGYRMLLGDLYLKSGRFASAETTFDDVLALDPGNVRASLNLVLARIALGRNGSAIAVLDSLSASAPPADLGLAYALAGDPARAVEMLEPAARATDANARIRQNLALAYAMSGNWQKAHSVASQDISPADLRVRLSQWAAFTKPSKPSDQVASLLNVTASEDPGQPVRLALAPVAPEAPVYAEAAPAPEPAQVAPVAVAPAPVEVAFVPAPVKVAVAEVPVAVPEYVEVNAAPIIESAPPPEVEPTYAAAVRSLVETPPTVVRAVAPRAVAPIRPFARPHRAVANNGRGRYVVQIGAFSSPASVEKAWAQAQRRYGFGADSEPLSTTVDIPGKGRLYRLAVAGFDTRGDASRVCGAIKAKSGACFVRGFAGDAPVRWASRSATPRG